MKKNLFVSLLFFIINLTTSSMICAQPDKIMDEDQFFWKQRERANISFGMDIGFTQTAQQYSELFQTVIHDEVFQFGLVLRGYFPFTRQIRARLTVPYYYKVGIEEEDKYPNATEIFPGVNDYLKNYGLGDLSADITWNILSQYKSPINLVMELGGTLAVGESRFHSSYAGILPLGRGFHQINFGIEASRKLSYKAIIFGGADYSYRFSREFKPTEYNSGFLLSGKKYDSENIYHLRIGVGYILELFRRGQVFNLEFDYFSVGSISLNDAHFNVKPVVESPFTVTRVGLRLLSGAMTGLSPSIFFGYEKRNFDGELNLAVVDRKADSWIINATFPMAIRFFRINL